MRALLLLLLLLAAPVLAAPRQAYVLRIEGSDAFVDMGRSDAAAPGTRLRVYRVIEARHPTTGKVLRDRFLLGEAEVLEAGEALSRIGGAKELLLRLEVGDEVELATAPPVAPTSPTASTPLSPSKPGTPPPPDAERAALRAAWDAALRLPPSERARVWEGFLASWPQSELASPIRAEIALLRAAPASSSGEEDALPPETLVRTGGPNTALVGEPILITLTHLEGPAPHAAIVHWRAQGAPGFQTVHMRAEPTGHFRAQLPQEAAVEPAIEYFVETADEDGTSAVIAGSATSPQRVAIKLPPSARHVERDNRSRVRIHDEYVDFNRFKGNDVYNLFEVDFLYRVLTTVHSVRVGFGSYQGRGTPKELLDTKTTPKRVGFTYGFSELEIRLHESLAALARVNAGVNREGLSTGVELGMRIGSETGTSLTLRGATLRNIGKRANLALAWDAVKGWPMSAEVIVTNEPIGEDLGVRLLYTVGRSVTPWLDVAGRVGYQLRDINHSGLTLGLGTTFHW
ncbi:hypothetical protein [Hyalangium sp.]|uniref:hypothetical protein n=1 Tax=Hyalangium sp. TaxID=2028555 RepID=UPI002D706170|nr:hypothetical protein [Hyalangium sp.]HYH95052.1 hypothetical protein [Hyalangium sp.]